MPNKVSISSRNIGISTHLPTYHRSNFSALSTSATPSSGNILKIHPQPIPSVSVSSRCKKPKLATPSRGRCSKCSAFRWGSVMCRCPRILNSSSGIRRATDRRTFSTRAPASRTNNPSVRSSPIWTWASARNSCATASRLISHPTSPWRRPRGKLKIR